MKIIISTILLCLFLLIPNLTIGDIKDNILRYRNISINDIELSRLQKYDHLISYFSSISYFNKTEIVSSNFIKALILAESSCNSRARSSKKALGLGQITHATGANAASELARTRVDFKYVDERKLHNLKSEDLLDPSINILLTCYLISKYNFKYKGRLDLVLTAWNAGENTPSLRNGRVADYQETKELIGKVNGYYLFFLKDK